MTTRALLLALLLGVVGGTLAGAASVGAATSPAVPTSTATSELAALTGRWHVDLRPSADAPEYLKTMSLEIAADRSVRGTFYDSEIESGRASVSNGRACFAFRTTDGVGPYHTSGCLSGDRILGQTWAEHRTFLLHWNAVRAPAATAPEGDAR